MLSKFIRPCLLASARLARKPLCRPLAPVVPAVPRRCMSEYIPSDQYDNNAIPKKLQLIHAMVVYWEIIPLVFVTWLSFAICTCACFWFIGHKVDVVYSTHNYNTIERTMNLNKPDIHKFIIINQRYDPWPEMQNVLDKMRSAEKQALAKLQNCAQEK